MAYDWVGVDNRVFMELNEQYDNCFAHIDLLGVETNFEEGTRMYTFDCAGHDATLMMLHVVYSLETSTIAEVYESNDRPEEIEE